MIQDYKTIDLFGKLLFENVTLSPPYKKPSLMPDEACFLYILKGEYNSISETKQVKVEEQESLLMKCGNYTCNMLASQHSETYQALAVHFYPDVLQKVYENGLPEFLTDQIPSNIEMSKLNGDALIHQYIEGVLFYFENPDLVNDEILILKLREIVFLLNQTQSAPAVQTILSNLFNPNSYSFREIIEAHYYSSISLEELAVLNNQSLSTFKRTFKKIYNTSPATYLRDKKLEKAVELLTTTNLRATDIAYECGFANVSHFSKTFKLRYGMAPTTYRLTRFEKILN